MSKPTSKLDGLRNTDGTVKQGAILNPTGKGGLQERPQDINRDGKPKSAKIIVEDLLSRMTPELIAEMNTDITERARKGDKDAQNFIYNRLAGTPKQSVDITSGEEPITGFVILRPKDDNPDGTDQKTS